MFDAVLYSFLLHVFYGTCCNLLKFINFGMRCTFFFFLDCSVSIFALVVIFLSFRIHWSANRWIYTSIGWPRKLVQIFWFIKTKDFFLYLKRINFFAKRWFVLSYIFLDYWRSDLKLMVRFSCELFEAPHDLLERKKILS